MHAAYLLHSRNYTDSRRLVEVFSPSFGRIRGVLRLGKGKNKGLPQLFTPLEAAWFGHGELKNISSFEPSRPPFYLQGTALHCGLYLNELLVRALHSEEDYSQLFDMYEYSLALLAANSEPEPVLRRFELSLLNSLGYGIVFDSDIEGNPIEDENECWYRYDVGTGFVACPSRNQVDLLLNGKQLHQLAAMSFEDSSTRTMAKRICRLALKNIIGDKPLKSRELFQ